MKTLQNAIGILGFIILVGVANAQHPTQNKNKEHKSEIKVNKLDVIYEDEEYKGVVIDRKNENETESSIYQAPFIVAPPIDDYDEEEQYPITMTFTDEGATSEDEILLEGYDTAVIHLPKLDVSSTYFDNSSRRIKGTEVHLANPTLFTPLIPFWPTPQAFPLRS